MWKTSFHNLGKGNMLEILNWEEEGKRRARTKPIFPWYVCKPNILQYLGQLSRQDQSFWAAVRGSRQGKVRSLPLWAAEQWHLLPQGAGCGWQPESSGNGNSFTALQRAAAAVTSCSEMEGKLSLAPWFPFSSHTEPLAGLQGFGSCLHGFPSQGSTEMFCCSLEGWEGLSTPRRVGCLRWLKRRIWRSNLKWINTKEGNLRDPETMALQICRWDHVRW